MKMNVRGYCGIAVLAALTGCTTATTHVRTDLEFAASGARIPKKVVVVVSAEARDYVIAGKNGPATWLVPVGQGLEPNALNAFRSILEGVAVEKAGAVDRSIELAFGEGTGVQLGTFTFSANTCVVVLKCTIKDSAGNTVWSSTVRGEASKAAQGAIAGPAGYQTYTTAIGEAASDALLGALQDLVNKVKQDKDQIFP